MPSPPRAPCASAPRRRRRDAPRSGGRSEARWTSTSPAWYAPSRRHRRQAARTSARPAARPPYIDAVMQTGEPGTDHAAERQPTPGRRGRSSPPRSGGSPLRSTNVCVWSRSPRAGRPNSWPYPQCLGRTLDIAMRPSSEGYAKIASICNKEGPTRRAYLSDELPPIEPRS